MKRDLRYERQLAHPPARVWRAVTEADLLGAWFMPNDLVPELGREFTFRKAPQPGWDGVTHCRVVELEPGRRIAYTYRGEATGEKTLACAGAGAGVARAGRGVFTRLDTVVSFDVLPADGGTRLVVEQRGFEGLQLVLVSFVLGYGWDRKVLARLPPVLDRLAAEGATPTSTPG